MIAVSMGDPVGIGPEIIVKAASVPQVRAEMDIVVFGDTRALAEGIRCAEIPLRLHTVDHARDACDTVDPDVLCVVAVSSLGPRDVCFAQPTPASDGTQPLYIRRAVDAVTSGDADALVTAPISKAALWRAGEHWPGHTEMLADILKRMDPAQRPVMMLFSDTLKVVPVTTHIPLAEVHARLTAELVMHAIRILHGALISDFGVRRPRIAVAGLNPHASEGGIFGDEEERVIAPAIRAACDEGMHATGPLAADSIFRRAIEGEFDAVVGMYHDQALIPIKLLAFDRAVNVTLGLPIIRTSVDHGTAYDLAGKGVASAGSMVAALRLASQMAVQRRVRASSSPSVGAPSV